MKEAKLKAKEIEIKKAIKTSELKIA